MLFEAGGESGGVMPQCDQVCLQSLQKGSEILVLQGVAWAWNVYVVQLFRVTHCAAL